MTDIELCRAAEGGRIHQRHRWFDFGIEVKCPGVKHEHAFTYDDEGRQRCGCGTYLFEHAPDHPYGVQAGPSGLHARWCLREDCDWRLWRGAA